MMKSTVLHTQGGSVNDIHGYITDMFSSNVP